MFHDIYKTYDSQYFTYFAYFSVLCHNGMEDFAYFIYKRLWCFKMKLVS